MNVLHAHQEKIARYHAQLDEASRTALAQATERRHYRRGEYLLQAGERCRGSFWLESGSARRFYLHDDKETTIELYFEQDLAVSFSSYTLQTPSPEYIQALTDTTATITYYTEFQLLKARFPALAQLDLLMTEYYALWLEERLWQFRSLDASQRYARLLAEQPQLVQTVQLTHIASFLGVSLETLSRIRAGQRGKKAEKN